MANATRARRAGPKSGGTSGAPVPGDAASGGAGPDGRSSFRTSSEPPSGSSAKSPSPSGRASAEFGQRFLGGVGGDSHAADSGGRPQAGDELRRAQVHRLLEQGLAVELVHVFAAGLAYLALRGSVSPLPLGLWLAGVVSVVGLRLLTRTRFLAGNQPPERALLVIRTFAVLIGLAWGAGALALHDALSPTHFLLLFVVFAGIVAGATSSLVMDRTAFAGISLALFGSLAAGILLRDQLESRWILLGMTVLFFAGMLLLQSRAHRAFVEAISASLHLGGLERTSRRERAFLEALISSAPTAIAAVDDRGAILGVNPAFERLFGYSAEEATGRLLDNLIVPQDQRRSANTIFGRVQDGEVFHEDLERMTADGELVPVRVSAAPVTDVDQDAVFVLYDDRSGEAKAHQALQEAERHYRELVESSSDLVWTVAHDGNWTFINSASTHVYGLPPLELVGAPFPERVAPEFRKRDLEMLARVFAGEQVNDYETVHAAADGTRKHLSFSARPIRNPNGDVVGAGGTARDVSERAAVRGALEEARELALHAAQAKSAFLANMSHEIRTPMNGVLGMLEVLLDSDLDADQRRAAEVIRSSGQALLTLIDDILDFSKLETDNVEIEEIAFDLRGLIDSTLRLLSVDAAKKGLELICEVGPRVPARVLGDPGRIRQVLTNLTGNALKFTHQGSITIEVRAADTPDSVRFAVRDTGIGIAPEKLQTIFDQFTQADASTTRQYGGTGLGLSICRGLVETMGGKISVRSEEGSGSEFAFWIPLPSAGPVESESVAPTLEGMRALVLDDAPVNRRVLAEALATARISADTVSDPAVALAQVTEAAESGQPYDFAVIDRQMPEMDGFEFARSVRETDVVKTLPLILLTSGPSQGDGKLCRTLGIEGYLPKPAKRADLLETISRIMTRDPNEASEPTLVTRHTISEARRSLSLLLVEDNPLNQEVAVALLERRGHAVRVVDNGMDALGAVDDADYDLVLMDIQLPGIDGVEATRRIRQTRNKDDLPIVALTAHAFAAERERALSAGMNAFLSKPFRPHELFAVVEGWAVPRSDMTDASVGPAGLESRTTEPTDPERPPERTAEPTPQPAPQSTTERTANRTAYRTAERSAELPTERPAGSAEVPSTPPVDVDGFRSEMREVGIEHIVDETINMFRKDAESRVTAIEVAFSESNLDEVRRLAHAFKSSAGTIRATQLQRALETLEKAAREGDAPGTGRAVEETSALAREALTHLDEVMGPLMVTP